ncbi:MAG: hypothetical protein KDK70_18310 [Myxococcales bacterium]|nr:hypothetical protein [Myxococcales bacterium]
MACPPLALARLGRPPLGWLSLGPLVLGAGCFNPEPPGQDTESSTTGPTTDGTSSISATSNDAGTDTSAGPGTDSSTGPVDPDEGSSSSTTDPSDTTGPACPPGELDCDGACIDPQTHPEHCGDCITVCLPTDACTGGQCISTCDPGQLDCDGQCTDPLTSMDHCGAGPDCAAMPGMACPVGQSCVGGICLLPNACMGFVAASLDADATALAPSLLDTRMAIAWDGANLWTSSGGGSSGVRLVQHSPTGMPLMDLMPGLDLRSVFTQGDGVAPLFARAFSNPQLRVQVAPGMFVDDVLLTGGTLDPQASVAWDPVAGRFIALNNGIIDRWDATGAYVDTITLLGYGVGNEGQYPQNRGVAFGQGCYLTLNDGTLSAWDDGGNRVDTITLNQAVPGDFEANFSVSFARGRAWHGGIPDWHGYDVFGVGP